MQTIQPTQSTAPEQIALNLLRSCQLLTDRERAHILADQALVDLLRALGFWNVADEFLKIEKCYA